MASLNTESLKQPAPVADTPGGVAIVFNEDAAIDARKPGVVYTVDAALAHHYCEVAKVASYVTPPDAPPVVNDRSMAPPPRGGRKGK